MGTVTRIEIEIDGNNIKAIKSLDGVESKLKGLDRKTKESNSIFDKAFNTFFGSLERTVATAVTGAAAGLGMLVKKAIDAGEEMNMLSQRTGVSVEQLSTLKYAADLSELSFEDLGKSLAKLDKTIGAVNDGNKESQKTFKDLGVSVYDSNHNIKSTDQILLELSDKFKTMPDGALKTADAMKLFGKSGAAMIPLLNEGSGSIKNMQDEAKALGLEMSTNFARQSDLFNDDLKKMEYALQGIGISLAEQFLPALTGVSEALVASTKNNQGLLTTTDLFGIALKSVATALGGVAVGAVVAGEALGTYWAVAAKIVTLHWGEVGETASKGFEQIKNTALTAGNVFDKLWLSQAEYAAALEKMIKAQKEQDALGEQRMQAEALAKAWESVRNEMLHENMKIGLSDFWQKESDLVFKANELKSKYYQIPGAVELINYNLAQQLNQLYLIGNAADKIQKGYEIPALTTPKILPQVDMTGIKSSMSILDEALVKTTALQDLDKEYYDEKWELYKRDHELFVGSLDAMWTGYDTFFNTLTNTSMSGSERMNVVWLQIQDSFATMLGEMIKTYIQNQIIQAVISNSSQAAAITAAGLTGSAIASMYAPAAALASIATFGAADAAAAAGLISTVALSQMLAVPKMPGFAKGGAIVGENGIEIIAPARDFASGMSELVTKTITETRNYFNKNSTTNNSAHQTINLTFISQGSHNGNADKYVRDELAPAINKAIRDKLINLNQAS